MTMTAPALTERQVMDGITLAARDLGFLVHHHLYSPGSSPGWPDLTICGHGKLFVIECKGPRGRVSEAQTAWIGALQAAGVDARFVWPDDLDDLLHELMAAYEAARSATT